MSEDSMKKRGAIGATAPQAGDAKSPCGQVADQSLPEEGQIQEEQSLLEQVEGKQWVALHCKPRAEKLVAKHCVTMGIRHYLPLRRQVRRYPRKVAVFDVPLFPGYLFCAIDSRERLSLLRTNRIVSILAVQDECSLLDELRQIRLAIQAAGQVERTDFDPTGRMVVVLTGPLAGLRGRVVEKRGKTGLRLNLGLLNQAALVQIDLAKCRVEVVRDSEQ